MNDLLRRTFLVSAALVLAGCAAPAEGKLAPPVRGSDSDWVRVAEAKPEKGTPVVEKNRWTLVVVFRPGSETCAQQMADVLDLKARFGKRGLAVVGVTASDKEDTEAFIKETGINFPVLADAEDVVDSFGIPAVDENHTYLINPPGVIVAQSDLPTASRILEKYMK